MVQTMVQSHQRYLLRRGNTYYFRFVLPRHVRQLRPSAPREIKRSLGTDSFATAIYFISEKLPLVRLIKHCRDVLQLKSLLDELADFSGVFKRFVDRSIRGLTRRDSSSTQVAEAAPVAQTLKLSRAWADFSNSRDWSDKQRKNNQLLFNNLLFYFGDCSVGEITKQTLNKTLDLIARLPQRNKKRYKGVPLAQLARMEIPEADRISGKTVREHLKLCQGFFSRYLCKELGVLQQSPTDGVTLDTEDVRFACLGDSQVLDLLEKSRSKPEWFQWMVLLAAYSGARRSELSRLRSEDIKLCPDTGRHYFVIRTGKTKAARRLVPMHRVLVDMGFTRWAKERGGILFSVANTNPNRVTDMFSSMVDVKVNDLGERVVFHSLRHTFITKARSAGVATALVQQVVGHEKSGAGITDRYTHTFPLGTVLSVVDSVSYSG